eukprot:1831959-Amphidinium_carterae.2
MQANLFLESPADFDSNAETFLVVASPGRQARCPQTCRVGEELERFVASAAAQPREVSTPCQLKRSFTCTLEMVPNREANPEYVVNMYDAVIAHA